MGFHLEGFGNWRVGGALWSNLANGKTSVGYVVFKQPGKRFPEPFRGRRKADLLLPARRNGQRSIGGGGSPPWWRGGPRAAEQTPEIQSQSKHQCRPLLVKKKKHVIGS